MNWTASDLNRAWHDHRPDVIHVSHPLHWLSEHSIALTLVVAGLITLLIIGIAALFGTMTSPELFESFRFDPAYPY